MARSVMSVLATAFAISGREQMHKILEALKGPHELVIIPAWAAPPRKVWGVP